MKSSKHEQQMVVDYLASQRVSETVVHLEKMQSHRVAATKYEIWNVHTDEERYWVITPPMNFYVQDMFPETDIALTFHIGLMHRVFAQERQMPRPTETTRYATILRRMEQAKEALDKANEAEDFQAIGVRCRECLIMLVKELANIAELPPGITPPQEANFKSWIDLLINTVARGKSNERIRSYMKSGANETWEISNWLTHAANATLHDAWFVFEATDYLLATVFMAVARFEQQHPDRCPNCGSYSIAANNILDDENRVMEFSSCNVCNWESEHKQVTETGKPRRGRRRKANSPCIIIRVPIRSEQPPRSTLRSRKL